MRHHLSACRWLGLARFAVLATVVLGLALPMRASAETVLKFGVASVNEGLLPLRVANDQGLFKAEGIAVEFLDFRGGSRPSFTDATPNFSTVSALARIGSAKPSTAVARTANRARRSQRQANRS